MMRKYKVWIEFKDNNGTLGITDVVKHYVQVGYLSVFTEKDNLAIDYHIDMSDIKYYSIHRNQFTKERPDELLL